MSNRKSLSALLLLATALPASTLAQDPFPDGTRLRPGVDTLGIYFISDGDTTEAGFIIDELVLGEYAGDSALIRVYRANSPFLGSGLDSLINTHRDLRPLAAHGTRDGGGQQLNFTADRVTGSLWLPNGQEVGIDTALPPNTIDSGSFDLALRASDLEVGREFRMSAFVAHARAVLSLDAHVEETEEVEGVDCWRVDANFVGIPITFWISRADRSLVRQLMVLQPRVSMLIDSQLPQAFSFHATFLEAIDRHGALEAFEARMVQAEGADLFALGAELSRRGIARLDDHYLLRRARLMHTALTGLDETRCADWVLGRSAQEGYRDFLAELDADQVRDWADVTAAAVAAELSSHPDPFVATDEDLVDAIETVLISLEENVADRLLENLWVDSASDSDVCWSGRRLYGSALTLDPTARAGVLRTLASIETQ